MIYEVTATRKRPQEFESLLGQEFVVATLTNSIATKRIAHAYMFAGPRGVGKTSAARILAKALNVPEAMTLAEYSITDDGIAITQGHSVDVIEIDGASHTSVNDMRQIKEEVLFPPQNLQYKIYIIDEVHMLSNSAFNALLKTIEEPPPYVVFIFATTEIHKVPATIRSRCQQFNFRLIPLDIIYYSIEQVCHELGISAERAALLWVAREARGSMRDAFTILDQVLAFSDKTLLFSDIQEKLGLVGIDQLNSIMHAVLHEKRLDMLEILDTIIGQGIAIEQLLQLLIEYCRSILLIKSGVVKESIIGYAVSEFDSDIISMVNIVQIEKAIEILLQTYTELASSINQRFTLELALSRLVGLPQFIHQSDILAALISLKEHAHTTETEHIVSSSKSESFTQQLNRLSAMGMKQEVSAVDTEVMKTVAVSTPNVHESDVKDAVSTPNVHESDAKDAVSTPNVHESDAKDAVSTPNVHESDAKDAVSTPNVHESDASDNDGYLNISVAEVAHRYQASGTVSIGESVDLHAISRERVHHLLQQCQEPLLLSLLETHQDKWYIRNAICYVICTNDVGRGMVEKHHDLLMSLISQYIDPNIRDLRIEIWKDEKNSHKESVDGVIERVQRVFKGKIVH